MIRIRSPSLSASDRSWVMNTIVLPTSWCSRIDLVLHVPADQRVERGERLVEQQDVRIVGERTGQPDPLLHAAGELIGVGLLVAGQADQLDDLGGARRSAPACSMPRISRP